MRATITRHRFVGFEAARKAWGLDANLDVSDAFPLLHDGIVSPKMHRTYFDYLGRKPVDDDHPLPVLGSRSNELSDAHQWTEWDKMLNPQLITDLSHLPRSVEYVAPRSGRLFPMVGWRSAGFSWKFSRPLDRTRAGFKPAIWQERKMIPKWTQAPRISAIHPDARYQGKLQFVDVNLSDIVWAIDTGRLNRNEVLTLHILVESETIPRSSVVWPGVNLVHDLHSRLKYPIHLELQSADPAAIQEIESAGGSFTGTYMSLDGVYQEMHPEEFPMFLEQNMPDRPGYHQLASNPRVRGFLSQWHEEEGKYAHPEAGRRLSHYRRPPQKRDFPASYDEYERVRHQQRWHLGQAGTGTVLPFVSLRSIEDARPANQKLTDHR